MELQYIIYFYESTALLPTIRTVQYKNNGRLKVSRRWWLSRQSVNLLVVGYRMPIGDKLKGKLLGLLPYLWWRQHSNTR